MKLAAVLAVLLLCAPSAAVQQKRPRRVTAQPMKKTQPLLDLSDLLEPSEEEAKNEREGWRVASFSDAGLFVFYNKKRIDRPTPKFARAWLKTYRKPTPAEKYRYALERHEYNCSTRENRIVYVTKYKRDGTIYDSQDYPYSRWTPVVPDSIGEGLLEIICDGKESLADTEEKLGGIFYEQGQRHEQEGKYADALRWYRSAVSSQPFNRQYREAVARVSRLLK